LLSVCLEDDSNEINRTIERYQKEPLSLDAKFITLHKRLGIGYFGEVYLGTIPSFNSNASIQVAIKVLKTDSVPNHKVSLTCVFLL
jgi:protein tyrosine kinase